MRQASTFNPARPICRFAQTFYRGPPTPGLHKKTQGSAGSLAWFAEGDAYFFAGTAVLAYSIAKLA